MPCRLCRLQGSIGTLYAVLLVVLLSPKTDYNMHDSPACHTGFYACGGGGGNFLGIVNVYV